MTNTTSKHDVNRKRIHLSDSSDSDAPLATKKVKVRTKYQSGSQAKDNAQSISPPPKRPQKKKTDSVKGTTRGSDRGKDTPIITGNAYLDADRERERQMAKSDAGVKFKKGKAEKEKERKREKEREGERGLLPDESDVDEDGDREGHTIAYEVDYIVGE